MLEIGRVVNPIDRVVRPVDRAVTYIGRVGCRIDRVVTRIDCVGTIQRPGGAASAKPERELLRTCLYLCTAHATRDSSRVREVPENP